MKKYLQTLSSQQGYLALVAVLFIIVISVLGVSMTYIFVGNARSTADHLLSAKAFWLAESALEQATYKLSAVDLNNRSACLNLNITNTLGSGAYSATASAASYVSAPSTLTGALSASATTIPVVSTTNYQSYGRIMIDREMINYAAISGNSFVGVTRGADGSVATTHASGAKVGQYQCNVSSEGGVSSLTSPANPGYPYGNRQLQESVQLQEAWAVGNRVGSNFTLIRWNRPTELSWNNAATVGSVNLNGVKMLSYVDGWAVSDNASFLRWNGSSWATVATGLPAVNYYGIYCSDSNNCHAVGNNSGSTPVIGVWNGSSWTRATIGGSTAQTDLRSVHCSASNDCWAVGTGTGKIFYYWNGSSWTGVSVSALGSFPYLGVFCNSSTDCWAVGGNGTFARKSGASWTTFATGMPSANYNSVFCNTSSDCWAVGDVNSSKDLMVHWNGTSWSRDASNPTPIANFNSVTCASSNDCWAVGKTSSGTNTAFIHWDGSSWTQVTPSGMPAAELNSVDIIASKTEPEAAWQEVYP